MPEAPITTTGVITAVMNEKTFRATVPNGKVVVVHLPKNKAELSPLIKESTQVTLEFTPYDLEKARISAIHSD